MMRLVVRVALGLGIMLSVSSMAAAQVVPGTRTSGRDPLLKRGFRGVSFGEPKTTSRPVVNWPETRFRVDTLGAPLPGVTAAPAPHGQTVPCVMRTVPVDPNFESRMPTVTVDPRLDPKSVIKIFCEPRD